MVRGDAEVEKTGKKRLIEPLDEAPAYESGGEMRGELKIKC